MTDVVDKLLSNSYSAWYRLLPNDFKEFIITATATRSADSNINSFNSTIYNIYQSVGAL